MASSSGPIFSKAAALRAWLYLRGLSAIVLNNSFSNLDVRPY